MRYAVSLLCLCLACEPSTSSGPEDSGITAQACTDNSQCPVDSPHCLIDEVGGSGYCTATCDDDADCPSHECTQAGQCATCSAATAGSVAAGGQCGCAQDCAGENAECNGGRCEVEQDCNLTGCPDGLQCAGNPPSCVECTGTATIVQGGACVCDAQCVTGFTCVEGVCAKECLADEVCGAEECAHSLRSLATCEVPPQTCVATEADGDATIGQSCVCNRGCGGPGSLCLAYPTEGSVAQACSIPCGDESTCPTGFSCCHTGRNFYCIADAVATAMDAVCKPQATTAP